MKATKCSKCGFVGFADQGCCKSCGRSIDLNEQAPVFAPAPVEKSRSGLWFMLKIVLGLAVIVTGIVFAHFKLTKYFDKTPLYLAAIADSEKFKEPVTVKVNRTEIRPSFNFSSYINPEGKQAGTAVAAADVLEALGLIEISVKTSVHSESGPTQYYSGMYFSGAKTPLRDVTSKTLVIELTDKGRVEAANWKEEKGPLPIANIGMSQSQQDLPWWVIPVGDREILRIESVTPAPAESNLETVMINFRWRWRPNKLGESFDTSNGGFSALPEKAQQAVTSLNMSSKFESTAIAKLHKQFGRWECVDVMFPSELLRK